MRWAPALALRWLQLDRRELAWLGECLAARELARAGDAVLARRVRSGGVEVDLVVRDAHGLVCVEVKTSTARAPGEAERWRPLDRVDRRKLARQERAAAALARGLARGGNRVRLDVVEVWIDPRARRFRLARHRGVGFSPQRPGRDL